MIELREGCPCPACGAPIWRCECEEPEHLICSGCGNDAIPDDDGEVSCDCPPLDDIDDQWFVDLAARAVMSLTWFREANPRPAGALWVPHHHGPGIAVELDLVGHVLVDLVQGDRSFSSTVSLPYLDR